MGYSCPRSGRLRHCCAVNRCFGGRHPPLVQLHPANGWYCIVSVCTCIFKRGASLQFAKLPPIPANAKYVQHKNECYDWGTFGWLLLKSGHVTPSKYTFIVLTNSSVRGPYLPPYVPVGLQQDCISWKLPSTCTCFGVQEITCSSCHLCLANNLAPASAPNAPTLCTPLVVVPTCSTHDDLCIR